MIKTKKIKFKRNGIYELKSDIKDVNEKEMKAGDKFLIVNKLEMHFHISNTKTNESFYISDIIFRVAFTMVDIITHENRWSDEFD
jgi:hypothetical protein